MISYLPLSHVAAHLIDGYMTLYCGGATYCADRNALRGTLVDNMREIRPTQFLGVPRVWEKMQEKMMEVRRVEGLMLCGKLHRLSSAWR